MPKKSTHSSQDLINMARQASAFATFPELHGCLVNAFKLTTEQALRGMIGLAVERQDGPTIQALIKAAQQVEQELKT